MIGYMPMPTDFRYKSIFLKGPPQHSGFDAFRLKHPSMDYYRRAKIFTAFDALKGFDEAVAAKEVLYTNKRELDDAEKEEIDYRLGVLSRLTYNSRMVRENPVMVTVTHYIPCGDKNNAAYGVRGQYTTVTGICRKVDMHHLVIGDFRIPFTDIVEISSDAIKDRWSDDFPDEWEEG